jgi:sugar (pentulose or hexulose) kinase
LCADSLSAQHLSAQDLSAQDRVYLLGIDGGSQSTKVVVHDLQGREVCSARRPLRPMHRPAPGVVEHPDDDLWHSLAAACRDVMAQLPDGARLAGIGLCTIRFCRALLRRDGSLAMPVLSWMDARVSQPYLPQLGDDGCAVAFVTTSSGYLTHRLTGQLRDTAANYQGQWPIDADTWAWSTDDVAVAGSGLRRDQLFELVPPGGLLGTVTAAAAEATGIPSGTPVFATANDKAVEAMGCGVTRPDVGLLSLGTYIAGMVTGPGNPRDTTHYWTNFASVPHTYLYESHGIRRGMWTVSWLRGLFEAELAAAARAGGTSVEDVMNAGAAAVPVGSDGLLTVLDWLAPTDHPYRRGVMLGFDDRHGWAHLYRSVLEGIALTMHDRMTAMTDELKRPLRRLVLSGGGARSDVMTRIVADVFDVPVVRMQASSGAALGAAICAAAGLGLYPDVVTAATAMTHVGDVVQPVAASVDLYRRLAPVHRSVQARTDPVLEQLHSILP